MKVYQIKIETAGVHYLKKRPTAKDLCKKLEKRLPKDFAERLLRNLTEKGWKKRPLPTYVCVGLGNPYGTISLTCVEIEVL